MVSVELLLLLTYTTILRTMARAPGSHLQSGSRATRIMPLSRLSFSLRGKESQFLRIPNWLALSIVIYGANVQRRK